MRAVPLSLSRPSPAPCSGNSILETCSGVLVPYTGHELDMAGNRGRAGRWGSGSSNSAQSQSRARLVHSQGPHSHRVEEGQVLSPFDRQLPGGVVVDDFRDTVERGAVLTQNVLLFGFGQFHVHKALVAPGNKTQRLLGSAEWQRPRQPHGQEEGAGAGGLRSRRAVSQPLRLALNTDTSCIHTHYRGELSLGQIPTKVQGVLLPGTEWLRVAPLQAGTKAQAWPKCSCTRSSPSASVGPGTNSKRCCKGVC